MYYLNVVYEKDEEWTIQKLFDTVSKWSDDISRRTPLITGVDIGVRVGKCELQRHSIKQLVHWGNGLLKFLGKSDLYSVESVVLSTLRVWGH